MNDYSNYQVITVENYSPNNSMKCIKAWVKGKYMLWIKSYHPLIHLYFRKIYSIYIIHKRICRKRWKSIKRKKFYDIFIQHPEIYLPKIKETKFFQDYSKYEKGLDYYKKEFFGKWKGEKAIGEIDPEYMYFDYVPERIYKNLGESIKLIFILRNPIDRAYSHYWMSYRRGYETESFIKAIELEKKRIKRDEFHRNHFSYISRGLYSKQIKRYLKFFPKKNMFFILFEEDFLENRIKTITQLLDFLKVNKNIKLNYNIKSNPASVPKIEILRNIIYKANYIKKLGKFLIPNKKLRTKILITLEKLNQKPFISPKLKEEVKKELLFKYFMDDIKETEELINRKLRVWYE